MEAERRQKIQVGIFMTVGLAAVLISIMLLGGDGRLFKSNATLYAKLPQVQGLAKGSVVSIAGLNAGNVSAINFAPGENALIVEMKVGEEYLDRIPKDSLVEVRTQGALGDKFVYIIPGDLSGPKAANQDSLQPNMSSDLMGVISERGGEAGRVFDILKELNIMLATLNGEGRLERILANVQESSLQIKNLSQETRDLIKDLRADNPAKIKEAVSHLNSILAKIDRGDGSLGALINDPSLHQQLKSILGENPRRQYLQSVIRSTIEKSEK